MERTLTRVPGDQLGLRGHIWRHQTRADKVHRDGGTLVEQFGGNAMHLSVVETNPDSITREEVVIQLQQQLGNSYVQRHLPAHSSPTYEMVTVQRQKVEERQATGSVTKIGPLRPLSYNIKAQSLAMLADQLASKEEAGSVKWRPTWNYILTPTGRILTATVNVPIDVTLPVWNPPAGTGPKTRAEWRRAFKALKEHEDGHIEIVQRRFADLASKFIGKTPEDAQTLFDKTLAATQADSDAYDMNTEHGRKTGTIVDTGIEEDERKRRAKE
jgi:hypothetical protein